MKAHEIAMGIADRYANHDTTAFADWNDVSDVEKGHLGITFCIEYSECAEAEGENAHLHKRALKALTLGDDLEAARLMRAVYGLYSGTEAFWSRIRKEYLLDKELENSFIGPNIDHELDAQRG